MTDKDILTILFGAVCIIFMFIFILKNEISYLKEDIRELQKKRYDNDMELFKIYREIEKNKVK